MYALTHSDLVVAVGPGVSGPAVPPELRGLPATRLRFDGSDVIDMATRGAFAIDEAGIKRLPEKADPGWPVLSCGWDAVLYRADGAWIVSPIGVTPDDVKAEARRRIIALANEDQQRNATARGLELEHKGQDNWTAEEAAEVAAIQALWARVKSIRAASDSIETMNPIPADYTDDRHWPNEGDTP